MFGFVLTTLLDTPHSALLVVNRRHCVASMTDMKRPLGCMPVVLVAERRVSLLELWGERGELHRFFLITIFGDYH